MKQKIALLIIGTLLFFACSSSDKDQTDPKWVVEQVFKAARDNDFSLTSELCDPKGEGSSEIKQICDPEGAPEAVKKSFIAFFEKGRVIGEPEIEGNTAKVKIKFGPDGSKDETMELIKKDEKWYLIKM